MTTDAASVSAYAFRAGVLKTQTQYMLKDTRVGTPMDIPVVFLVIRHGQEWVAFDTGCNLEVTRDPIAYWGEKIASAYTPIVKPEEVFREAIQTLGLVPGDFKAVILSHGDLDHAGAIDSFAGTGVPVCFQKAEMREIRKVLDAAIPGESYCLGDFQRLNELNLREIEGVWDVFGDRTVVVFPTPGHTPGHQSLHVRPSTGVPFIYGADALYTLENMERSIPPGSASDLAAVMQHLHWFRLEEQRGVRIVPSHDPGYWAKRRWAPEELVP